MHIELVNRQEAPPVVQRIFEAMESSGGTVSNFSRMVAHKPDVLRAYNQMVGAVMNAEGALPRRLKELAYLRASLLNACTYCAKAHTAVGKRFGMTDEQIAALKEPDGRRREDVFTPEERAILRYTDLLTTHPGNMDDADLDALGQHLNQEQIVELAMVIATANWTNRVNEGLRTPL